MVSEGDAKRPGHPDPQHRQPNSQQSRAHPGGRSGLSRFLFRPCLEQLPPSRVDSSNALVSVTVGPQVQGMPVGLVGWWTGDEGDNHNGVCSNRVCTTHATPLGGVSFPRAWCSNTFALDGLSGHLVVPDFNHQFTSFTFMFLD